MAPFLFVFLLVIFILNWRFYTPCGVWTESDKLLIISRDYSFTRGYFVF